MDFLRFFTCWPKNVIDVWFHNVELITAREIGREPVDYVGNIYKYYLSYKLAAQFLEEKGQLRLGME